MGGNCSIGGPVFVHDSDCPNLIGGQNGAAVRFAATAAFRLCVRAVSFATGGGFGVCMTAVFIATCAAFRVKMQAMSLARGMTIFLHAIVFVFGKCAKE